MIYECFNFNDELDLLDIRLHELNDIVDKVVLVEATKTFTNKPKILHFEKNKKMFKKFLPKIIHIVVDDSPDVSNPWIIENHQLSAVSRGLKNCKPKDTILLSCVDELPKKEKILEWKDKPGKHKAFLHYICYYYANYKAISKSRSFGRSVFPCSRMFKFQDLITYTTPYIARFSPIDIEIPDGGWHFKYIGGIKRIQEKLTINSHQEFNNSKYNTPEHILKAMLQGKDFLEDGFSFQIEDNNFLPTYIRENKEKFSYLILNPKDIPNNNSLSMKLLFLDIKMSARKIVRKVLSR